MEVGYKGLTSEEAKKILQTSGFNEIPEIKHSLLNKIIKWIISPITIMLFFAAILSLVTNKIFDFYFILSLLLLNTVIGIWQENKADNAIKKLNQHLKINTRILRDGNWVFVDSREIVKNDIIQITVGDVVPADGVVINAQNLTVNESMLTGESLPKEKKEGDNVYSGSFIATGLTQIKITATGKNTYFGKTLISVDRVRKKSILEQDILRISKFLSVLSLVAVLILSTVFFLQKVSFIDLLTLDLSLIIAGIPVSLPTVMTLIIELGVVSLASKNVIVRRLSALEDLANVNLLLTDKTGTLTQNKINIQKIFSYNSLPEKNILLYAFLAALEDDRNLINKAILEKARSMDVNKGSYNVINFIPADSVRKRSSIVVQNGGEKFMVSVGAPQVIESLCDIDSNTKNRFQTDIQNLASDGDRTLAIAINEKGDTENKMQLLGILALSDTLRDDAKEVVNFMRENNIATVMLTGDNKDIAHKIARELEIDSGKVLTAKELRNLDLKNIDKDFFYETGAFAEILPDDKYKLVEAAKRNFVTAVTGDGVNDLPAIKEANVGIAVKNATDALKSTADIVLLSNGISVIKDSVLESRKIFSRLYSYSVYRISESLRLIVTITILGIFYKVYPLNPLQLILLALLNDIPIISLAFDKVRSTTRPSKIKVKERFILSSMYGMVGVMNSLFLFFIMTKYTNLSWNVIQTIYFLKLTVSGHLLIYVARTKERWFRFLPSKEVILATTITQLIATILAITGILMPGKVPILWIIIVWVWSFFWMQISELTKRFTN